MLSEASSPSRLSPQTFGAFPARFRLVWGMVCPGGAWSTSTRSPRYPRTVLPVVSPDSAQRRSRRSTRPSSTPLRCHRSAPDKTRVWTTIWGDRSQVTQLPAPMAVRDRTRQLPRGTLVRCVLRSWNCLDGLDFVRWLEPPYPTPDPKPLTTKAPRHQGNAVQKRCPPQDRASKNLVHRTVFA